MKSFGCLLVWLACSALANALTLNLNESKSILNAAAVVAHGVQSLYNGNQTGGVLGKWPYCKSNCKARQQTHKTPSNIKLPLFGTPDPKNDFLADMPYYWWESGGAWGSMMQYQLYTGDMSYHNVMHEAVVSQLGKNYDFIMESEAFDTGNDDQAFWVFIAMAAAEYNYPAPPAPAPSWLRVVQNAFEEYVGRWNTTYCGGGLKWQFNPKQNGFHYKQSISNGAFFQISARLARHTGNQTYALWAEKVWDWSKTIGLIDDQYNVYDGSDELINCAGIDHHQWSYNIGVYLYGAAVMQNLTNSNVWVQRTVGLLDATSTFFSPFTNSTNVLFEPQCETDNPMSCNTDQQSMKAYLIRWLAGTSQLAPFTSGRIGTLIRTSAKGAAASCTGGPNNNTCGTRWYVNSYDGTTGLGQQIAALEIITALLVNETAPPGTLPGVRIPHPSLLPTTIAPAPTVGSTGRPLHDPKPSPSSVSVSVDSGKTNSTGLRTVTVTTTIANCPIHSTSSTV